MRNQLESMTKQRESQQQQLRALISEKHTQLERFDIHVMYCTFLVIAATLVRTFACFIEGPAIDPNLGSLQTSNFSCTNLYSI